VINLGKRILFASIKLTPLQSMRWGLFKKKFGFIGLDALISDMEGVLMVNKKLIAFAVGFFLILPIFFIACSGGGGSGGSDGSDDSIAVELVPQEHDFGIVTLSSSQVSTQSNSTAALEVKIQNESSQDSVVISNIALSDMDNFDLDFGGGSNPCNTSSPTIGAGDYCSVEVFFQPLAVASYSANLRVKPNDNQTLTCQLSGVGEMVTSLNVAINQVESDLQCPTAKVTAYVSVTDQVGYPITGLLESAFTVLEDAAAKNIEDFSFVSEVTAPISVGLVMDNSGSITDIPEALVDMQNAVASFVDQLAADDEAEIVKFGTQVEVVQNFTSDKNLLKIAIEQEVDIGRNSAVYDATYVALDDTSSRIKERKALIVVSDGRDSASSNTLSDVISFANEKGIPIFTVGIGEKINTEELEQMANDTGGQYFNSPTTDNLLNIYNQLSDILFEDQYIIKYISALGVCETADLTIQAEYQTIIGDDTQEITPCCP
jgi:Ca-activated chloride channel family protein